MSDEHNEITARMHNERELEAVELACKIIQKKDNYIVLTPFHRGNAADKSEIDIFSDNGDIIILSKDLKTLKSVEVKRLSEDNFMGYFSDRASWTLPNFIVDGKNQFAKKKIPVALYMCFNSPLSYVAVISVEKTIKEWTIETKAGNGTKKEYYVVDPDLIDFKKVEDLL